ncbi:hypothetical protein TNCT_327161 [Trichonephila clavata]|uniref:Uncharacterized protein n=1 Tax=Trichonephila clavata TaxID=2740835 RepID=A0A8X6GGX3_TRICU|nr:hypothetical protein TNCT_327161 [Trichonephila clavata]
MLWQRSGRPVSVRTDFTRVATEHLMDENRPWMLLELERVSGIEKRAIHRILRDELHLHKIAARWVLHALMEVQRWLHYATYSDHFARCQQNGNQFLS